MADEGPVRARAIRERMIAGDRFNVDEVLDLMHSEDADLRGAAVDLLMTKRLIDGSVNRDHAEMFLVDYLAWCMSDAARDDRPTIFKQSPYDAADTLCHLYRGLRHRGASSSYLPLAKVRQSLKVMYLEASEKQKNVVINGFLEHVLEDSLCRSDFDEWKQHPLLVEAVTAANDWRKPER